MKTMSLEQKESKISQLRTSIQELQDKLNPLTNEVIQLQKEVNEEKMNSLLPLTLEKLLSSHFTVMETDLAFKEISKLMKNYPYVHVSGHNTQTKTKWVEVMFRQAQPFAMQRDCALRVIKLLPYQNNEAFKGDNDLESHPDKFKLFGVFHQKTQHDGVYQVIVEPNENAYLINTRYGRMTCVQKLPLEEMLKYIYDNHPYESLMQYEEDDED